MLTRTVTYEICSVLYTSPPLLHTHRVTVSFHCVKAAAHLSLCKENCVSQTEYTTLNMHRTCWYINYYQKFRDLRITLGNFLKSIVQYSDAEKKTNTS